MKCAHCTQNGSEGRSRWIGLVPSVSAACLFVLFLPLLVGDISHPANAATDASPSSIDRQALPVSKAMTDGICAPQVAYTLTSDFGPINIAYDPTSSRLFIANPGSGLDGNLTVIVFTYRTFLPLIIHSSEAALSNDSNRVSRDAELAITASANSIAATHVITGLPGAHGVAFDVNHNLIYVGGWNWLYVVDGATYTVSKSIKLSNHTVAHAVAYNPTANKVYISDFVNHEIKIVNAANWSITTLFHTDEHPLAEPAHIAVNPVTNRVYVSNHNYGTPPGWVTVISDTTIIGTIYLDGDLYGIAVDTVRNRVYVASISAARLFAFNGTTYAPEGDLIIVRASDGKKVPLRMVAVNPSVGGQTHLWLTTNRQDWINPERGWNRVILLSGNWPDMGTPRATEIEPPSVEGGLVVDPSSWNVFVASAESDLVTALRDGPTLCSTPLSTSSGEEKLYTVVHDYEHPESKR